MTYRDFFLLGVLFHIRSQDIQHHFMYHPPSVAMRKSCVHTCRFRLSCSIHQVVDFSPFGDNGESSPVLSSTAKFPSAWRLPNPNVMRASVRVCVSGFISNLKHFFNPDLLPYWVNGAVLSVNSSFAAQRSHYALTKAFAEAYRGADEAVREQPERASGQRCQEDYKSKQSRVFAYLLFAYIFSIFSFFCFLVFFYIFDLPVFQFFSFSIMQL